MTEEVKEKTKHFKSMTDEQLLRIVNSMPTDNEYNGLERFEAEIELHKRQKKPDRLMLIMTFIILVLTGYLAYKEFTKRELTHSSNPVIDQSIRNTTNDDSTQNKPKK
jgi:hypothetical protein